MPPSTAVSAKDSDQRENLTSYGWFMQDSIQLTDKWLVMGGLRYDAFDVYAGRGGRSRPTPTARTASWCRAPEWCTS